MRSPRGGAGVVFCGNAMRSPGAGVARSFAWLVVCCMPRAAWASEEWVTAPSGARLKLTPAKFRLDFESCLADCGSGASLATIGSAADQEFVNELLRNEGGGGAYNVLIGNYRSPGGGWLGSPSGGETPSFFNWRNLNDTDVAHHWRTRDPTRTILEVWTRQMANF